jgi:hypothetical protein
MRIETDGVTIEAEVGSVTYWHHEDPMDEEFEITGVSAEHVEALARADRTPGFSAGATLAMLTYLHRNEHFDSAGSLVPPATGWDRDAPGARSAVDRRGRVRL